MPAPPKDIIALHAKLERAEIHIRKLQDFWDGFRRKSYPVASEYDRKIRKYVFRLTNVAPIPADIPLIAGDAIQNARSALDHLAYRLVCVGLNTSTPPKIYFPIGDTPKEFESRVKAIKEKVRPEAVEPLESIQAYQGGNGELLWQLKELNNIDKHRLLLTVTSQNRFNSMSPERVKEIRRNFLGVMVNISPANDYRLFLTESLTPGFDLKAGHILGMFSKSEKHKKMEFPIEIAFAEPQILKGKPLIETLWLMFQAAQSTVMEFDSAGLLD